jgi:hypothetical protein
MKAKPPPRAAQAESAGDGGPSERRQRVFSALRQIAAEEELEVRVVGGCMAPILADGGRVRVRPARFYWPGDVVVVRSAEGRLLAHRLLGLRPWRGGLAWVTQGDGCAIPDTPVASSALLGRVEGVNPSLGDRLRAASRLLRRAGRRGTPPP